MKCKELKVYLGKPIEAVYLSQRYGQRTLVGVISVVHGNEIFITGKFPERKSSSIAGGIWVNKNRILEVKEQENNHGDEKEDNNRN